MLCARCTPSPPPSPSPFNQLPAEAVLNANWVALARVRYSETVFAEVLRVVERALPTVCCGSVEADHVGPHTVLVRAKQQPEYLLAHPADAARFLPQREV